MKIVNDKIILAPTDLSNHLGCAHLTELDRQVLLKKRDKPEFNNPSLKALAERGLAHEQAYVKHLQDSGKNVEIISKGATMDRVSQAMARGVDVIVQAPLENDRWAGIADLLIKVNKPSKKFEWSYEVADTKLAVDTKAGTILQLSVYSDILSDLQGTQPEYFQVIKPGSPFEIETFRYDDYKAYYNYFKAKLENTINNIPTVTYPEPVEQCDACRWWKECDTTRRKDDHLSLVANIRKIHIDELNRNKVYKLEEFAKLDSPLPGKPERGHLDTFLKVHHQAKIQWQGKGQKKPIYEVLPIIELKGFNRLPEPDEGDIYFDFEGDRYYPNGGLEYLFGIVYKENQEFKYRAFWAFNRQDERKAFDEFMQFVMKRWDQYPGMHIYHYAPYEPSAIKRLMSRHALHEQSIDKILRGGRFIDLYSTTKEILIASVEAYSIKYLERLTDFERKCNLEIAGPARRALEYILEFKSLEALDPQTKDTVQEYNADDCFATKALHQWLEARRDEQIKKGEKIIRPEINDGKAKDELTAHETRLGFLFEELKKDIPTNADSRDDDQKAKWLLAHLVHYFDREKKNDWWEFFHVHKMDLDDLYEEKNAIAGLEFVGILPKVGQLRIPRVQYRFPQQEIGIEVGTEMHEVNGEKLGKLEAISIEDCSIVISHQPEFCPYAVHGINMIPGKVLEESLLLLIEEFKKGISGNNNCKAAGDLLLKRPPSIIGHVPGKPLITSDKNVIDEAIALASKMDETVLAVQGPPGTGKTYIGARIVLALLKEGKKIGITAVSHKVIRNLMNRVHQFAKEEGMEGKIGIYHKTSDTQSCPAFITPIQDNQKAFDTIRGGVIMGATSYFWADKRAVKKLDYLIVDEAGQMSLANVLASSQAAQNLILLGDPQQLEQPQKGAHPEGADTAALSHYMGGDKTIASDKGIFLGTTHRLHPSICKFTSELFYESKLESKAGLKSISIQGTSKFQGSGLFYVPVNHVGRQTSSPEEVACIKSIVDHLTSESISWKNKNGETSPISLNDILVVAPYNSQVKAILKELPNCRVGTVDKFQGQEAAIVIYSTTCSSAEEAPRGMTFLYSPNRLNVATSRAQCVCILVGAEKLFEAECRNPDQMKWVNAFCRFKEMAQRVEL